MRKNEEDPAPTKDFTGKGNLRILEPFLNLCTSGPYGQKLSLYLDSEELVQEGEIVARMKAMPDSKEEESDNLGNSSTSHELEPLVNVNSHPVVGVNVEAFNDMSKLPAAFQPRNFHIGAALPVNEASLLDTIECQARDDTHTLCTEPGKEILGQDEPAPDGEQE